MLNHNVRRNLIIVVSLGMCVNAIRVMRQVAGLKLTEGDRQKFKLWSDGVIPYFIDDLSFDKVLRDRIRMYLQVVNSLTAMQFAELFNPPKNETMRWVLFINRRGVLDCGEFTSKNLTSTGVQRVVLGYDCMGFDNGPLASIVLALAGVLPQHNSPNRGRYIRLHAGNILPERKSMFDILPEAEWLFHDIEYDYASAGHYHSHEYTKNGLATIEPKVYINIGEAVDLSSKDVYKIAKLYNSVPKDTKNIPCSKLFHPGSHTSILNKKKQIMKPQALVYRDESVVKGHPKFNKLKHYVEKLSDYASSSKK